MGLRERVDVAEVVRVVVNPALSELLKPGELDSVTVGWVVERVLDWPPPSDRRPGVWARKMIRAEFDALPREEVLRLVVDLSVKGERFRFSVVDDDADVDLEWRSEEFYGGLQDFIAESRFGWGELRGGPSR